MNEPPSTIQFKAALERGIPTTSDWISCSEQDVAVGLPEVQRVSAASFADPITEIARMVQSAVRDRLQMFAREADHSFSAAEEAAREAVEAETEKLRPFLAQTLPSFKDLQISTGFDFMRPHVEASVQVDLGRGLRPLGELGDGSRRRAWIALEHKRGADISSRPVLRLYDEPDVNLHYEAQRTLFRAIRVASEANPASTTVICTHAVTLIDRASPSSLRVLRVAPDGTRTIDPIVADPDAGMLDALAEAATGLGLGNLSLLYEKAFLIVEGDTEYRALPALYRSLHGTTIEDDGIRLLNIDGCSAWRSVIKVLLEGRKNLVHLLLDTDCSLPESTAKLTAEAFADVGIALGDITFIGSKEFEDAFSDEVWANALNQEYPSENGEWQPGDIAALRGGPKFSEAVKSEARTRTDRRRRSTVTKPELGAALGKHCAPADVPQAIQSAFVAVRKLAGQG